MLKRIQINPSPAEQQQEDCFTMLLSCHSHIRHFAEIAVRLSDTPGAAPPEVASAAKSLFSYFTVALPLHEADENVSIDPRVQRLVPETELAAASKEMVEQHGALNAVLRRLIPR